MTPRRLLRTLVLAVAAPSLVCASAQAPATAQRAGHQAVGYKIPTASGQHGGWIGSYQTSNGGPKVYCADPLKRGPSFAGGYSSPRLVSHWKRVNGKPVGPAALRRAGWILSAHGETESKKRAAAVDTAVHALMTRGAYGFGRSRSDQRLRATGHGREIKGLARQMLGASKRLSGPARLYVGATTVTDDGGVSAMVRLTSRRTGRPIAGAKVRVRLPGRPGSELTKVTGNDGTAHVSFTVRNPGTYQVRAAARDLASSRVWVAEPHDRRAQRMLVAGRTEQVRAADTVTIKAHPQVSTMTSDFDVTPGTVFRDIVRVTGLEPGYHRTAVAELYGPARQRAQLRCDKQTVVRRVRFTVDGNGTYRTPPVKVHRPGRYTWLVRLPGDARNVGATHRCATRSETTLVRKRWYAPPTIDAGYTVSGRADAVPARAHRRAAWVEVPAARIVAGAALVGASHGTMDLPGDVDRLGWLDRSARPGDLIGSTVIAGHVSDRSDNPGAMWNLTDVHRGNRVRVHRGGETFTYRVFAKDRYSRSRALPHRAFATTGRHKIALISCTDRVRTSGGGFHYTDNIVVLARAVR